MKNILLLSLGLSLSLSAMEENESSLMKEFHSIHSEIQSLSNQCEQAIEQKDSDKANKINELTRSKIERLKAIDCELNFVRHGIPYKEESSVYNIIDSIKDNPEKQAEMHKLLADQIDAIAELNLLVVKKGEEYRHQQLFKEFVDTAKEIEASKASRNLPYLSEEQIIEKFKKRLGEPLNTVSVSQLNEGLDKANEAFSKVVNFEKEIERQKKSPQN